MATPTEPKDNPGTSAERAERVVRLKGLVKYEDFFDEDDPTEGDELPTDSEVKVELREVDDGEEGGRVGQLRMEQSDADGADPVKVEVDPDLVNGEEGEDYEFSEDLFCKDEGSEDDEDGTRTRPHESSCVDPLLFGETNLETDVGASLEFHDESEQNDNESSPHPCSSSSLLKARKKPSDSESEPRKRRTRKLRAGNGNAKSVKSRKQAAAKAYFDDDSVKLEVLDISAILDEGAKVCPLCQKDFKFPSLLKTHMRIHTQEMPYKCSYCDRQFAQQGTLDRHLNTHPEAPKVNKQEERARLREIRLTCPTCGKLFAKNQQLLAHSRTHTGERPFKCSECGKSYKQPSHLKTHMMVHTGEKSYQCTECEKSFSESRCLRIHMRVHTGEKPFKCSECDKSFRQLGHLQEHTRIHTGEKPYECKFCYMKFAAYASLYLHLRYHRGEKPHKCSNCNKAFSQIGHLKYHLNSKICTDPPKPGVKQIRKPRGKYKPKDPAKLSLRKRKTKEYPCPVCSESFHLKSRRRLHILESHPDYKAHECKVCSKRFTHGFKLRLHLRSHSTEKPYLCWTCGKRYHLPSSLFTHRKKHAADNADGKNSHTSDIAQGKKQTAVDDCVDSQPQSLQCQVCGKIFTRKQALIKHEDGHNKGAKYCHCITCPKQFISAGYLRQHVAECHKEIFIKPDLPTSS